MHRISDQVLDLESLKEIYTRKKVSELPGSAKEEIRKNRDFLEKRVEGDDPIYGINTGFGSLCDTQVGKNDLEELQHNLILSHATGMGDRIPAEISRLIFLLKIRNLVLGRSGVRLSTIEKFIEIYNAGIIPVIYEMGSLGASGDLAPLAHLAILLIGKGKVHYKDEITDTSKALNDAGISPINLSSKEGLALLNGTQFSTAFAIKILWEAKRISALADLIASTSIYGFNCQVSPYSVILHTIRKQDGQAICAGRIRDWLAGGNLSERPGKSVQDPYSFRCSPQVHGATYDTITYAQSIVEKELNSITDNPSIFHSEGKIISGGNFHAQPIALILDYLGIALSEIASISERRLFQLTSGLRGLPNYLVPEPGLHSGVMITQYTAASIVSQNKQLATPASVDSITSSKGQEDHVSMAANAATKCLKITRNVKMVLSIELFSAVQALSFLEDSAVIPPKIHKITEKYREEIPFLEKDRLLHDDMMKSLEFLDEINV